MVFNGETYYAVSSYLTTDLDYDPENAVQDSDGDGIQTEFTPVNEEVTAKDVVNLRDCRKMGHVIDFEFDECTGCISKIMVPGVSGFNGFKRFLGFDTEYVICYPDIKQIGPDIILVDVP